MKQPLAKTTCPYCGVGCGVAAPRGAARGARISGDVSHPVNAGRLCSKGSLLGETTGLEGRLLHPMKKGARIGWDEALDEVAAKFTAIVDAHGPDAVAFYVSGQLLTEDYYVANKLMKGFIGSGNIDTNSRLCMSSAVAAHKRAFGEDVVPGCYEDFEEADLVVLVGSNTAWCHPILYQRLLAAKAKRGTRIVVIDPRRTATCDDADLHLPIAPGADLALFNTLFCELAARGVADPAYVANHTEGLEEALAIASEGHRSVEVTAEACGLDAHDLETFIRWFAETERVVTAFSQGVNQSKTGVDQVNAIVNCHLLTGRIGRPGTGPFSITGQPNAMGGREVGGLANQLAAHLDFTEEGGATVARFWQTDRLATSPGLKAVDLFDAVAAGRVKALWIVATNPVVSLPNADFVRRALKSCDFVVLSDCIARTDTAACADILLPAAAWGEKDGTVTNSERRISRQRSFMQAAGEAKPDWWIVSEVARRMGFADAFPYRGPADIFREHARLSGFENDGTRCFDISALSNLSDEEYEALAPVQWPVHTPEGTPRLFGRGGFPTPSGRARFAAAAAQPRSRKPTAFPLRLNSGRLRDQWHTMTRTGLSPTLSSNAPEPVAEIHEEDARAAGITDGGFMRIVTEYGSAVFRAHVSAGQRQGSLFIPIHWSAANSAGSGAGCLAHPERDPLSGQPAFKHTPARAESVQPLWRAFFLSRREIAPPSCGYWVVRRVEAGWLYELAGLSAAETAPELDTLAGTLDAEFERIEMRDGHGGALRQARLQGGRLVDCLLLTRKGILPLRDWLVGLLASEVLDESERRALLSGHPAEGQHDEGRVVCACMGVRSGAILAAIAAGACNVAAVGEQTGAGTNCGSCRSEIRSLVGQSERDEAA
ncbi:nitrate reductase [Parvibaculum sp.]|uniref:nitrate reductase n=1 Tax=Parvibaculum sp. TaxID=2024848 RepID=UPI00272FD3D0|nr:nitrate reductase [Parvibaculum sp.]MDP1627583.1 molybdopterin-dependent oxidoreductase [Parvibaculum sp.]MDP2148762.1 molybdopterin-dependent oxidoreductase [Parvibaculum sp.]MDP3328714.1 molybdopterin-dependent oxidoreductase [Parvibaculum sp.]